jgi:ketosteroid isomerase-like protein
MRSWLAKKILSHNMARIREGDYRPTLRIDAEDVKFTFPGKSSWAGVFHGKKELEPWLQRFVKVGLQTFVDEVIVKGPPWHMTLSLRGTDYAKSPAGEVVYENRFVIWGYASWGRLKEYELYEDTEKSQAFDDYLSEHEDEHRLEAATP